MDAIRGILLTLRTPRLWGLCLAPTLAAVTAYVLLGVAGWFLLVPRLSAWLGQLNLSGSGWLVGAETAAVLIWLLLFPFLFILIAGGFAALIFDPLSHAVEVLDSGGDLSRVPGMRLPFGATLQDSLSRLLLNACLGIAAILLGFVLGPIPGILAAGTIGLLDYTSPAYLRRGVTLGPQWSRLFRPFDVHTVFFGLIAGLLSLVPFVGVLLLPGLVAGATLLVRRREAAAGPV